MGRANVLIADLKANAEGAEGPAAFTKHVLLNTGFQVVLLYRVSSFLSRFGTCGKIISRLLQKFASDLSACHIHSSAEIGPGLRLPHATGIVIGIGCKLGKNISIYQNVTIGTKAGLGDEYPTIGDGVTIYAGAVIAGNVRIGDNAIVGANSVVLDDIDSGAVAVGVPARAVRKGAAT